MKEATLIAPRHSLHFLLSHEVCEKLEFKPKHRHWPRDLFQANPLGSQATHLPPSMRIPEWPGQGHLPLPQFAPSPVQPGFGHSKDGAATISHLKLPQTPTKGRNH